MQELQTALSLATEEELHEITAVLFQPKFNPWDYWRTPRPVEVSAQESAAWRQSIEQRFRFLAADGLTVLKGHWQQLSYHQVLVQICQHLKLPYQQAWSSLELESELFLRLAERLWRQLPADRGQALCDRLQQALAQSPAATRWPELLTRDSIRLWLEGSSAIAINSLIRPWLLQQLSRQLALEVARYQLVRTTCQQLGALGLHWPGQLALQGTKRAILGHTMRYGAVRSALGILGPVLWGCFLADLGWRAIATNYARIIPVVFTLAQIRLIRSEAIACVEG
ncbi:YaaW family protein [Synechococcus elongatus]|uniref:YaaW family protein n=1 Tax=Synechococcus elongatus PCC 11801 TaxID=2219813 RepID=A0AAN1QM76_SYNEL|nr:YaaW family protein [Synechococcus elongatus]AZB71717.1 hypothetical protein DOP62_02360 [Synechococcus elongatus PCC 11801]